MKSHPSCPVCGNQTLIPETHEITVDYAGAQRVVRGLENYVCTTCGADPALADQVKRNELRIADAKRSTAGLLTGAEIREIREELGLSQADAALLFGGGANAFSKYERGEVIQSVPMDRLLRCVSAHPHLVRFLRAEFLGAPYSGAISDSTLQVFHESGGVWPNSVEGTPPKIEPLN